MNHPPSEIDILYGKLRRKGIAVWFLLATTLGLLIWLFFSNKNASALTDKIALLERNIADCKQNTSYAKEQSNKWEKKFKQKERELIVEKEKNEELLAIEQKNVKRLEAELEKNGRNH